ncbi:MAG TPA: hydrogenase expression/formation protein HypE [Fimbriimonas sp.]
MNAFELRCPLPMPADGVIQLAHGGGGRVMQRLLETVFLPSFANEALNERHDASVIEFGGERLAMTTDAFVVRPWRFPGGDIGSLAVHGTVNDLAMAGAKPVALSAAFVLEEGLARADLAEIVESMRRAAEKAGVPIVTGDTKVVERGKGDGVYIATTGVGKVVAPHPILPRQVRVGDAVLLSGDVGRHGAAVISVREGLEIDAGIESDSASVHEPVLALLAEGIRVHCLRDVTRGGLATVLNEVAVDGGIQVAIEETRVPITDEVAGVCEILGLDPLYVACEGRFVAFVAPEDATRALGIMRRFEPSADAVQIGSVRDGKGLVTMKSRIGVERVLDLLSGEQLPRIC